MSTMDIIRLANRADAADKRMQHLQEQIDRADRAWRDQAVKIRDLEARLDNSAAAHADEFAKLEERLGRAEASLRSTGLVLDQICLRLAALEDHAKKTPVNPWRIGELS